MPNRVPAGLGVQLADLQRKRCGRRSRAATDADLGLRWRKCEALLARCVRHARNGRLRVILLTVGR